MGEPARNLDDDELKAKPSTAYDRAREQWGMYSSGIKNEAPEGLLEDPDEATEEKIAARKRADEAWGMKSATPGDLAAAESNAASQDSTDADETEKAEVDPEDSGPWKTRVSNAKSNSSSAKKLGIATGIAGIFVAGIIALVSFLLPFKLTGIIESIEQRVGQVPEYAVERRIEYYMTRYLMIRTLEGTGEFDFTVDGADRNKFAYLGNTFWDSMYTNWKGARLEKKLVTNHGLKLTSTTPGEFINGRYKLRAQNFTLQSLDPNSNDPRAGPLNRTEARQFIRDFAKSETKSVQVFKRYNMRKVMKKYYGVGNWRPFEKERDEVRNKYNKKKLAFRTRLINETVGRLSDRYPLYMGCLLDGGNHKDCRDTLKRADPDTDLPDGSADEDGRSSATEQLEENLDGNGSADGDGEVVNRKLSREIMDTIQEFSLKKILTYFAGGIGIIDSLSNIYSTLDSGVLNQVIYDKNAQQYLAYTAPILSAADQIRAGENNFDPEDAQVANELFSNFEQSLVYQAGSPSSSDVVSAASQLFADCNNNEVDGKETLLDAGETVCPSKQLVQDKTGFTESAGWQALGTILEPYRDTVGNIIGGITNAISSVTSALGIDSVISSISSFFGIDQALATAFSFLLNQIAGPVASGAEEGGDAYDNVFAGIAVQKSAVGGEVGVAKEDTIGGAYLSNAEVAAIRSSQMEDYYYALNNKPLLERYLSPLVKESITGRFAMYMPTSVTSTTHTLASSLNSGFGSITSLFNIFTRKARADTFPAENPFHVINMGFPVDHAVFTANGGDGLDPDEVSAQFNCETPVADRPQNQAFDDVGGELPFPVPREVDPCLLEEAALDAGTRYFTGTYNEGLETSSSSPSSPTSAVPGANQTATVGNTANIPCAPGTTDLGEETGYSESQPYTIRLCGIPGFESGGSEDEQGLVRVNSTVSGSWLSLFQGAQGAGIILRANSSFRSMALQQELYDRYRAGRGPEAAAPGTSNHQMGFAVDIDIILNASDPSLTTCRANPSGYPRYEWLAGNAPGFGMQATVDSECWHWASESS